MYGKPSRSFALIAGLPSSNNIIEVTQLPYDKRTVRFRSRNAHAQNNDLNVRVTSAGVLFIFIFLFKFHRFSQKAFESHLNEAFRNSR